MKKSLIPLMLGGLGIGTTEFVMMGLLPDIAKDFQISIPVAGYLISAYALGVVIGAPLLVAISSNYPPKKILMALMVMFTVFNAFSLSRREIHRCLLRGCYPGYHMGHFLV